MTANKDELYDDLEQRTRESYQTRQGERTFRGIFRPDISVPAWSCKEGEHRGNIIPYRAGENDPRVRLGRAKAGSFTYVFDHHVHQNVGPRGLWFLCLEATYQQACSICEERNRLRTAGAPETESLVKAYEARVEQLRPRRRVMYNWECLDNQEEADKGVQVWEIAHWLMEVELLERAKQPREEGGALINFAHPKLGMTIWFKREGSGQKNTRYKGHRFIDRREEVPVELLEEAFTLDELIHVPTYDEVRAAFWDEPEGGVEGDSSAGEEVPGEEIRRPGSSRLGSVGEEEAPQEETQSGLGDMGEQGDLPRRRTITTRETGTLPISVEEDYAEGSEKQEASPEPVSASEEPLIRRRRSSGSAEDSTSSKPKLGPVAAVEAEVVACSLPEGTFGVTGDEFAECSDCEHWNPCMKATVKHNRSQ